MSEKKNERVEAMKKMGFNDFRNATPHKFDDISSETFREYEFPEHTVRIDHPVALNVNFSSGGHRVWDAEGTSHYIPGGWKHLSWKVDDDKPHFVK